MIAPHSRDDAYVAYLRKNMRNMEGAPDFEQLSKIDDVSIRQRAALEIYRQWKRKDAASAQKWIEATPHIPAEWKSRLSPPE